MQTSDMGKDESSLLLSLPLAAALGIQSPAKRCTDQPDTHGSSDRAASSLVLCGCCVPSLAQECSLETFARKAKGDYTACVQGAIFQRPVTDFPMSSKGHILTLKCCYFPIPSQRNFKSVSDRKSHSKKGSQTFLKME